MKYTTAREARAQQIAKELSKLMDVKLNEWVNDVRATRRQTSL